MSYDLWAAYLNWYRVMALIYQKQGKNKAIHAVTTVSFTWKSLRQSFMKMSERNVTYFKY